jgi:hypothetical protein
MSTKPHHFLQLNFLPFVTVICYLISVCQANNDPTPDFPNTMEGDHLWAGIPMPTKSYFEGMTQRISAALEIRLP